MSDVSCKPDACFWFEEVQRGEPVLTITGWLNCVSVGLVASGIICNFKLPQVYQMPTEAVMTCHRLCIFTPEI